MSDLLQEVDDALRAEKAEKFWKENGPFIIGGAVLLVVLTGIFTAYNSWQLARNTKQTAGIITAIQSSTPDTALIDAAPKLDGQHKAMALLGAAGFKANAGEKDEALKLYQQVASDRSAPALLKDLAALSAVRTEWGNGVTKERASVLYGQLKPLLSKGNPWYRHAAIQAAMITGDNLDDPKTAVTLLRDVLSDPMTPQPLKEKAQMLDHLYINAAASKSEKKDDTEKAGPKG